MTASGTAASNAGTPEWGTGAFGAVHVVVGPVADEHAGGGVVLADRRHRGPEGLRVRLGPGDLAAVDRAVDQFEDLVAREHPLVRAARPHRVGEHPDLDAPFPQAP